MDSYFIKEFFGQDLQDLIISPQRFPEESAETQSASGRTIGGKTYLKPYTLYLTP
jgi:hypothetical protein